jgi:hypothetical protein
VCKTRTQDAADWFMPLRLRTARTGRKSAVNSARQGSPYHKIRRFQSIPAFALRPPLAVSSVAAPEPLRQSASVWPPPVWFTRLTCPSRIWPGHSRRR